MESDFEGNKQLNLRPDYSSTTYSDSDETFLTDRETEEDLDLQLQGISSLMDDSKSAVNKDRQCLVHDDLTLVLPSSKITTHSDGEVEKEKASSPMVQETYQ